MMWAVFHCFVACVVIGLDGVGHASNAVGGDMITNANSAFKALYQANCAQYPFIQKYHSMLRAPSKEYLIFVYHDTSHHVSNGGLGDRLAGLVTAFLYALRTNRNFLIEADAAFEHLFRPFVEDSWGLSSRPIWSDWSWSGWNPAYSSNMTKLHCVNPRPGHRHCALENQAAFEQFKVIKYYGNRAYLCRWFARADRQLKDELTALFGSALSPQTDLYHATGCAMRAVLYPTEQLWNATAGLVQLGQHAQVAAHFRCGDSSFTHNGAPSPECYFNESIVWKGTSFSDDRSMDSPVDLARCSKQLITSIIHTNANATPPLLYVASDSQYSATQIIDTAAHSPVMHPTERCHIDLQKSVQHCAVNTLAQWFALSLSDYIVTQALIKPSGANPFDDSIAYKARVNKLFGYAEEREEEPAPASAFSRFAAIYSLKSANLRYGRSCAAVGINKLGLQTHGNWVCDPKTFF